MLLHKKALKIKIRKGILLFSFYALSYYHFSINTRFYGAQAFYNVRDINIESYLTYSTDVTYENGMYILASDARETYSRWLGSYFQAQDYYFTCGDSTTSSCEEIIAVFPSISCSQVNYPENVMGLYLSNNENIENKLTFYLGKDYIEEDGMYRLVDYEEHNLSEINRLTYLSRTYGGYYMCPSTYGLSCDDMIVLFDTGSDYNSTGESLDHWHLIGDGYQYSNGHFKLINPRRSLLATTKEREGYTCISKEDTCDEVYYVEINEFYWYRDGGRPYTYYKVELPNERETDHISLMMGDEYKIDSFFTEEEINEVIITDPSIVEIDKGAIIAKKAGETSLIYETDGIYKELMITITEQQIKPIENPKTSYKLYLVIGVLLMLLIGLNIIHKKEAKQD